MMIVGNKLLYADANRPVAAFLMKKYAVTLVEAQAFWINAVVGSLMMDTQLMPDDIRAIKNIYLDWVKAPAHFGEYNGKTFLYSTSHDPLTRPKGYVDRPVFPTAQQSTQFKVFPNIPFLVRALIGNHKAAAARQAEERLAFAVLARFVIYERLVIDPLVRSMSIMRAFGAPAKSFYGAAATINWAADDLLAVMHDVEPLVRLYRKIAALHDLQRALKLRTPNRDAHSNQRLKGEKYSLNEEDPEIQAMRAQGISVWAGKSGSTMDMMYMALHLGLVESDDQTILAYCIAAFFHFMPTIQSSTHTFHEVMRGAKTICPDISYNPQNAAVPATPPIPSSDIPAVVTPQLPSKL